ncbi:hypothetical protein Acsp05_07730 [Actinokineospora sp. NBRC 105648]|nr:hypothetical protein Acsp05_07730 [Actinokineospora sp. NBRC 105648]
MIDSVSATLKDAKPEGLNRLYRDLDRRMVYTPEEQAIDVTACPRVASACVRRATCALAHTPVAVLSLPEAAALVSSRPARCQLPSPRPSHRPGVGIKCPCTVDPWSSMSANV